MKGKFILLAFALVCTAGTLLAQGETPRVDLFGGYSHTGNFDIGQSGWIASGNLATGSILGLKAEISGHYGSESLSDVGEIIPGIPDSINSRMHNFNIGPSGTYRTEQYNVFGHLLFGFSRTNVNAAGISEGDTSFSWVLGGGADYNFTPSWAVRGQLDLLRTNFFDMGESHGRISFGVVYRFGS